MIVHTQSGTVYEFRYRYAPEGWDGERHNDKRTLSFPIEKWEPCVIPRAPEMHRSLEVHFPSIEKHGGSCRTSAVTFIEITDEEREIFGKEAA